MAALSTSRRAALLRCSASPARSTCSTPPASCNFRNLFSFAGTIEGFSHAKNGTIQNTIELTNAVGATTAPYVGTSAGGTLVVEASDSFALATLDLLGDYTHDSFAVENDGTNTFITTTHVACFAAGTRILTTRGEVSVERLTINDLAVTLSGTRKPIRWIGRRRIDLDRHPAARTVAPIRVLAGAFADGVPHRDLLPRPTTPFSWVDPHPGAP